jgi:hypothetical protein
MNDFKRAELAIELAHEDREYNPSTPSKAREDLREYEWLLSVGSFRNEMEELEFIRLRALYF